MLFEIVYKTIAKEIHGRKFTLARSDLNTVILVKKLRFNKKPI